METDPDETPDVHIERLAAGGDGVGRLADGCVIFVPLTAPGDVVRTKVIERRARFARGEVLEILTTSPERTAPECAVFGTCGGCAWQHIAYPAQLAAKQAIVADALKRVGRVDWPAAIEITPSPEAYRYRGRARVHVEDGHVGYRQRASRGVCATQKCPVLVPPLEEKLAELAADPAPREGEWELLASAGASRCVRLPGAAQPRISFDVGGDSLRVSPGVFVQSNVLLHETLVARVLDHVGQGGSALELHAGAGFFTLGLARRFDVVVAVEAHPGAVSDLRANLAVANVDHVSIHETDVATDEWPAPAEVTDAVLVDPPRTGIPRVTLDRLLRIAPRRLVYLSCDPATLSRDLGVLVMGGFSLTHIEAFDLFPQTSHVEVLAVLEGDGIVPDPDDL